MASDAFTIFQTAVADLKRAEAEALAAVECAEALGERCERLEDDGEGLTAALATTRTVCAVATEAAERLRCQQVELWNAGRRLGRSWVERIEAVNRSKNALLARQMWGELRPEWQTAREVAKEYGWMSECLGQVLAALDALRDERPT